MTSEPLETILGHLDDARLAALLTDAAKQHSPTFFEEPAMQVFAARLAEAGLGVLRQPVPAAGAVAPEQRANLIVELGPQPAALIWVGHVDTVPMLDDEQPQLRRQGDRLYGLGTADMKSGCAAAVEAVAAMAAAGVRLHRGLSVALVVGEEEYGDGSQALLSARRAPLTVIGEPTGLSPCLDHHGYYECRLTARGKRAHAATPEVGESAIEAMLQWLRCLPEAGSESARATGLTINTRQIHGGSGLFAVPTQCEAVIDIHALPGISRERIEQLIRQARSKALSTRPGCTLDLENLYWAPGHRNAPDEPRLGPLQRAFAAVGLPWQPSAFPSHSDAHLFQQQGSVAVICGPGRLELAHTADEHVSLQETSQAARLYAALFCEACVR